MRDVEHAESAEAAQVVRPDRGPERVVTEIEPQQLLHAQERRTVQAAQLVVLETQILDLAAGDLLALLLHQVLPNIVRSSLSISDIGFLFLISNRHERREHTHLGGRSSSDESGDAIVRKIEQPELAHTAQRRQGELAKLVVRQVEDLQRSEWIKGASVTVAVRTAEEFEGVMAELEVLQHLGLDEIVRVQLRRHRFVVVQSPPVVLLNRAQLTLDIVATRVSFNFGCA